MTFYEVYKKAKGEVRNVPGSRTRETYGRGILLDEDLRTEQGNFRNEEGSDGNQLFIGNGP